jgi:uncharacterized protein
MLMKYLTVLLVVVVVGWLLLRVRKQKLPASRDAPVRQSLAMVECQYCGVHLPRVDCIDDRTGTYCCEDHRLAGRRSP